MFIPSTSLENNGEIDIKSFAASETKQNLLRAFAGESQARNRYTFAAQRAKTEGYALFERIFTYTADQEKAHAAIFFQHLQQGAPGENISINAAYPVDDGSSMLSLLQAAHHNEFEEFESAYPAFADTAEREGFPKIAAQFRMIAEIEQSHGERFHLFASYIEKDQLFKSPTETKWVCLNCGNIVYAKEAPLLCPVCSHNQGYFIREELAPFTK